MNHSFPAAAVLTAALVGAALPPRSLGAQTPTGTAFGVQVSMHVRVPSMAGAQLGPTLGELLATATVRSSLQDALVQNSAAAGITSFDAPTPIVTVVEPTSQAIVRLEFLGQATTRPELRPEVRAAIATVLRQHLEQLLLAPLQRECDRDLAVADDAVRAAEQRLAETEANLQKLGLDDFAALQTTLFELRRQATELDLDLRTEQAVAEHLTKRYAEAMQSQLDADAKAGTFRGAEPSPALQRQHAAVDILQAQVTQSALALQRCASRRQVLGEILAALEQQTNAAADRSRQRGQTQRECDAAQAGVVAARQRREAAQRNRASLRPVEVQSWQ